MRAALVFIAWVTDSKPTPKIVKLPNGCAVLAHDIIKVFYAGPEEAPRGTIGPRVIVRSHFTDGQFDSEVIYCESEAEAQAVRGAIIEAWEAAL